MWNDVVLKLVVLLLIFDWFWLFFRERENVFRVFDCDGDDDGVVFVLLLSMDEIVRFYEDVFLEFNFNLKFIIMDFIVIVGE